MLIDARKGVLTQTRRHSYICSLLGIRHVVLAVNKIDLIDFEQRVPSDIVGDYEAVRHRRGSSSLVADPAFGALRRQRDRRAPHAPGIDGEPLLLDYLRAGSSRGRDARQAVPACRCSG
jgi:bifunctional enzyme CysN/CysC